VRGTEKPGEKVAKDVGEEEKKHMPTDKTVKQVEQKVK
jgi:hypothetical protein